MYVYMYIYVYIYVHIYILASRKSKLYPSMLQKALISSGGCV